MLILPYPLAVNSGLCCKANGDKQRHRDAGSDEIPYTVGNFNIPKISGLGLASKFILLHPTVFRFIHPRHKCTAIPSLAHIFGAWQWCVKQRATLSRLGVETASNSFHLSM